MSGGSSGAGRFNSSEKCSVHLLSCSWTVVRGFPCLSLTGLSVCWYLPTNFMVMSNSPFLFLCAVLLRCQCGLSYLLLSFSSSVCELHCSFFRAASFAALVRLSFKAAFLSFPFFFCSFLILFDEFHCYFVFITIIDTENSTVSKRLLLLLSGVFFPNIMTIVITGLCLLKPVSMTLTL